MGRKSLKKDRAYLTTTEWANEWGGYKDKGKGPLRQLPFFCCAIAFTPFEDPVSSVVEVYLFLYLRKCMQPATPLEPHLSHHQSCN